MSDEAPTLARRAGIVGVFTLGSRILGYVRDATLSNIFGATGIYDAFVVAQTIPNLLRRLVAEGALVVTFVPLLAAEREAGGHEAMQRFTRAVLGMLLPLLVVLVGLGLAFPEVAVDMFAAGFDAEREAAAVALTRIMMPYIALISLVALAGGILNTVGVFAAPAAAPILLNVAIIGFAVGLRDRFAAPIEAVGWGVVAGGLLQLALQIPGLASRRLLVRPSLELSHPALRILGRRMLPAVFGVAVYQINVIAIRQVASFLPPGQLSWYYNATRLQEFALGVFAVSVSVAALPTLSEHAAKADWTKLVATYRRALRITNYITVPTSAGLIAVAGPVVAVLFRHGRFSAQDAASTAELLQILVASVVPIGVVRVVVPTFYALGDTKTPVVAATASLLTTIGLSMYLVREYHIHGLCIAVSVAAVVQWAALWLLLRRRLEREAGVAASGGGLVWHSVRCALAVAPGTALAAWVTVSFDFGAAGNLAGAGVLAMVAASAGASYLALSKLLRIEEADAILALIRRRLRRRA